MTRRLWVAAGVALLWAGCDIGCPSTPHSEEAFAANTIYQDEIDACVEQATCTRLCMRLFGLQYGDATVTRCRVTARDVGGATVRVDYEQTGTCDGDTDIVIDDSTDDSTDDGSDIPPDDGSDTPPGDGSDDPPPDDPPDDPPPDDPPPDDSSRSAGGAIHVQAATHATR